MLPIVAVLYGFDQNHGFDDITSCDVAKTTSRRNQVCMNSHNSTVMFLPKIRQRLDLLAHKVTGENTKRHNCFEFL